MNTNIISVLFIVASVTLPYTGIAQTSAHTCGAPEVHNPNLNYGSVADQEGHVYKTIVIGTQEWMAENLIATSYQNGDPIPNLTDETEWSNTTSGAWCYYLNSNEFECPYGKLYNWYAASDARNVCPVGWHVPSDAEWTILTDFLGGYATCGGKMKSTATNLYWADPNTGATNESGFSALAGSGMYGFSAFNSMGIAGYWWSSSADLGLSPPLGEYRSMFYNYNDVTINAYDFKNGFSIRCMRNTGATGTLSRPQNTPITVYPIPASESIVIQCNQKHMGSSYTIFSASGKHILSGKIYSLNSTLDLSNLTSGIYTLQVGDVTRETIRIVKD